MLKIHFVKNKGVKKRDVVKIKSQIENYYMYKFPKVHGVPQIPIEMTEQDVSFDVVHKEFGINSEQRKFYGTANSKQILRREVDPEYHIIFHIYKNTFKPKDGYVAAFATFSGFSDTIEYIEMPLDAEAERFAPIHEVLHAIGFILVKKGFVKHNHDQMDRTIVDGISKSYYKNDQPEASDGNYARTLKAFAPYFKYLGTTTSRQTLVQELIQFFLKKNAKKETSKYKHFKESEVVGLNEDFVHLLDKARDIAGIPFVINSGFRTPSHNKTVGGVPNSAHLTGLAVDIRARNGEEMYLIVKAAIDVGIKRIGINRASQFCHLDNDLSKPNPRIYEY